MPQVFDIRSVTIDDRYLTARVRVGDEAPLTTDQDLVGTTLVYRLMPEITEHACLGDRGTTFKDAMPATELPHLLEHVTVELMARTGLGGEISSGRTMPARGAEADERCFDVQLSCPDDVLTAGALSSAAWICEWAFNHGDASTEPDVNAIVDGLVNLVRGVA
jgi:hypothetical protein